MPGESAVAIAEAAWVGGVGRECAHFGTLFRMQQVQGKLARWQSLLEALAQARRELTTAKSRAADSMEIIHLEVAADDLTRRSDTAYVALLGALLAARTEALGASGPASRKPI